jgi:hypothetical protein
MKMNVVGVILNFLASILFTASTLVIAIAYFSGDFIMVFDFIPIWFISIVLVLFLWCIMLSIFDGTIYRRRKVMTIEEIVEYGIEDAFFVTLINAYKVSTLRPVTHGLVTAHYNIRKKLCRVSIDIHKLNKSGRHYNW